MPCTLFAPPIAAAFRILRTWTCRLFPVKSVPIPWCRRISTDIRGTSRIAAAVMRRISTYIKGTSWIAAAFRILRTWMCRLFLVKSVSKFISRSVSQSVIDHRDYYVNYYVNRLCIHVICDCDRFWKNKVSFKTLIETENCRVFEKLGYKNWRLIF